jgi:hypothetical protein
MPSPRRLFRNFTTSQIQQLLDSGFDRALYGTFTSLSGGAKSSGIQNMDLSELLMEANYELGIRGGTLGPTKTYQDFTGNRPSITVNE